jgi:predicted nucleotide-binding protein
MNPDEMAKLLESNNIAFTAKGMEHGAQFRLEDGAIACVYNSGKVVWQGKRDSEIAERVRNLSGEKAAPVGPKSTTTAEKASIANNKVFIVYGHDIDAREQLELLLRRMKLEPVILQNLPVAGDTVIEKLESNLDVRYACVLLTPDDEGHTAGAARDRKFRARQNVILELGMFLVRLGRKRVAILYKGDMELPSDIAGLIYIKFKKRVDEVKERLGAELQEAGFPINIKDLLS